MKKTWRRRERLQGAARHPAEPVIPPAPLTGDVGRGCGDASRALLFLATGFSATGLIPNEFDEPVAVQPRSRLAPPWCQGRLQASLRPAEIDARFVHVQHSKLQ